MPTIVAEGRKHGVFRQRLRALQRLGQSEVDHLGHRPAVVLGDQNVRGLNVAVDNPFLVGMLHRLADLHEQIEPGRDRQPPLVAVLRQRNAVHQLHDEIGATIFGRAAVEHFGDIRMVHQRQRLALGFKPGQHGLGSHAGLDQLEGDHSPHRLALLGHPDRAHAPFADHL